MDTLVKIAAVCQIVAAVAITIAAVYMARFKFTLIEDLKELFYSLPSEKEDYPFTRRQALSLEEKLVDIRKAEADQWTEINRVRDICNARAEAAAKGKP